MVLSNDLQVAAQKLGAELSASPLVQEYIRAQDALSNDAGLAQLEAKMEQVYQGLVSRQRNGEVLLPRDVNEFYELRESYNNHPLVTEFGRCQAALRVLCGEVGSTISSILSVDYTELAVE